MLILSQLSFRATWFPLHSTAAPVSPNSLPLSLLSLTLCFPNCFPNKPETYWTLLTRFLVWLSRACCNICSSWGLYVLTGITQPAQHSPTRDTDTHAYQHTHTQRGKLSCQPAPCTLVGLQPTWTLLHFFNIKTKIHQMFSLLLCLN